MEGGTPKQELDRQYLDEQYQLYQVSSGSSSKPILVGVTINGANLETELDTGASVPLISEETFCQLQETGATLCKSRASLFTYTG